MEESKLEKLITALTHTLSMKRTKITLYIAVVLWVAVATQVVVNRLFQEDLQITEAFIKTETQEMESSLEIAAKYEGTSLSEAEKNNIIFALADAIGLTITDDISVWKEDGRSEYYFFKQAKQATSEIKIISLENTQDEMTKLDHYVIVRLNIQKGIESMDEYKKKLENSFEQLGLKNTQVTLKFEGYKEGDLTNDQKFELAKLLVESLQGEIALEYDEGDLYTVYGYTGMLKEYITSLENKINIQIAITYNELTNKTSITLATPILNDSW